MLKLTWKRPLLLLSYFQGVYQNPRAAMCIIILAMFIMLLRVWRILTPVPAPDTTPPHLCVVYKMRSTVKLSSAGGSLLTTDTSSLLSALHKTRNVTRRLRNTALYHVSGLGLNSPTTEFCVRIFWSFKLRSLKLQTLYLINCILHTNICTYVGV